MWLPIVFFMLVQPAVIPANTSFNIRWGPLPDTVDYRIKVDGEQIGADWPAFFPTNINLIFGPATNVAHYIEVYSINAAGVASTISVTINGAPTFQMQPPTNLRRIIWVVEEKKCGDSCAL